MSLIIKNPESDVVETVHWDPSASFLGNLGEVLPETLLRYKIAPVEVLRGVREDDIDLARLLLPFWVKLARQSRAIAALEDGSATGHVVKHGNTTFLCVHDSRNVETEFVVDITSVYELQALLEDNDDFWMDGSSDLWESLLTKFEHQLN